MGLHKTLAPLGNINVKFDVNYESNGGDIYLCVHGWTKDPLVEYFIVDSWGDWRPPGGTSRGQIKIDDDIYDIYSTFKINYPSIDGFKSFSQFWSVRRNKRTSGTISVNKHFDAWTKRDMRLGKLYEALLSIEGYRSSGKAIVLENTITEG